jgi:hypothetical protein
MSIRGRIDFAASKNANKKWPTFTDTVLREGWLSKRSPTGLVKTWKKRWFRLVGNGLHYGQQASKNAKMHNEKKKNPH